MKITTVTARTLVSGDNYTHQAVEATASVGPRETADDALARLQEWVEARAGRYKSVGALNAERQRLTMEMQQLRADIVKMTAHLTELRKKALSAAAAADPIPF